MPPNVRYVFVSERVEVDRSRSHAAIRVGLICCGLVEVGCGNGPTNDMGYSLASLTDRQTKRQYNQCISRGDIVASWSYSLHCFGSGFEVQMT
jgi:hypothetical protein